MHKEFGFAVGAIVLLLALYVGAYLANVGRVAVVAGGTPEPVFVVVPVYRLCPEISKAIFEPMHQVDRWVRPSAWERAKP
jgi:hypothetical protein